MHLWINAGPKRDERWWACTGNLALSEKQSTDSHWQLRTTGNTEWPLPTGTPLAIALTLRVASCLLATKRLGFPGFAQRHGDRFYFLFFFGGGCLIPSRIRRQSVQRARLLMMIATLPDYHSTEYCSRVWRVLFLYRSYHKARYIEYTVDIHSASLMYALCIIWFWVHQPLWLLYLGLISGGRWPAGQLVQDRNWWSPKVCKS